MVKESRKPAQPQDIRSVKGRTPENFLKQLPINGNKSTLQSRQFNTTNQVKVGIKRRGGGSVR